MRRLLHLVVLLLVGSTAVFADPRVVSCHELTQQMAQDFWLAVEFTGAAESAVPKSLVAERHLRRRYSTDIEARYQSGEQGVFFGRDQHGLSYRRIPSPFERATVVLVPGMGESMLYYKELIFSLTEEGYSVYIFDPRGQGWSGNLGRAPQVVHVRRHTDYVDDLQIFLSTVVLPHAKGTVTTLGNSNGALTAIRLAQEDPQLIQNLVAIAPPLRIYPDHLPRLVISAVSRFRGLYTGHSGYALGVRDLNLAEEGKKAAARMGRYALMQKERLVDPSIARGGPSNQWVAEVVNAGNKALAQIDRLKANTLLIVPQDDVLVVPRTGMFFGARAATTSTYPIDGAGHFVLFERDTSRNAALTEIFRFLVNPNPLTRPAVGDEVADLVRASDFYAAGEEWAFARYAMDEALRVHEAKRGQNPDWDTEFYRSELHAKDRNMWEIAAQMSLAQVALYKKITGRRLEEIQSLYAAPIFPAR